MSAGSARRSAARSAPVAAALTAVALLAACTTSGHPASDVRSPHSVPAETSAPVVTPSVVPTTEPPTSAPATSDTPTTSAPPPSSTSASPSPSPSPVVPQTTCTSVAVRVLPGGASFGEEIAAVQLVNSGTSTCVIAGYPTVTLYLHGKSVGDPSQPSSIRRSARTLKPGGVAESLLHDYTQTCQAPLSDSVHVQVPGTSITYLRPHMQLRACVLRVDRLGAPS